MVLLNLLKKRRNKNKELPNGSPMFITYSNFLFHSNTSTIIVYNHYQIGNFSVSLSEYVGSILPHSLLNFNTLRVLDLKLY